MPNTVSKKGLQRFPDSFLPFDKRDLDQPIHALFERQVRKFSAKAAVRYGQQELSYSQLNQAANQLARHLLANVQHRSGPIALLVDQGFSWIVSLLAVLKVGRAYAPLDCRLQSNELQTMIDDLKPAAILADTALQIRLPSAASEAHSVLAADTQHASYSSKNLSVTVDASQFACIYFTSGSTGDPKGVVDSHRNVVHNVMRYTNSLGFVAQDCMSLVQNPSFSGTVSTIFGALLNGATLTMLKLDAKGLDVISHWVREEGVTVFHSVPALFRLLNSRHLGFPNLRVVRLEGDAATGKDVLHFKRHCHAGCVLVNGFGVTECGLVSQLFVEYEAQHANGAIPAGFPLIDIDIEICDDSGAPLPPASLGEVVVISRFLALGYWNDVGLSEEKFRNTVGGVRRYHSGDLGRLSPDGSLTIVGRKDSQARINGEFIDSTKIETTLTGIREVSQAVVQVFHDHAAAFQLAAYVVRQEGVDISVTQIKRRLARELAPHLVPAVIVFIDALPTTRNGKIDRGGLRPPTGQRPLLNNEYVAPATELERRLASTWSEVLGVRPVGVLDSFFDLGGNSLRAAEAATRCSEVLDKSVSIVAMFEFDTIRALALSLESARNPAPEPAPTVRSISCADHLPDHSVAVIGMSARVPGAGSIDEFWTNLLAGRESIAVFDDLSEPRCGRSMANNPEPDLSVERLVPARGVLDDVDSFDAAFFNFTPRQARCLDPQQRVWLECVYHALEDAGLSPRSVAGRVGVFAGSNAGSYLLNLFEEGGLSVKHFLHQSNDDAHLLRISNDSDSLAMRTSFVFDFNGPSVNIQTTCSTSLVAIAQACAALEADQCDFAIAGGVSITFPQRRAYRYYPGGIYSQDGHCRAFDSAASGTVVSDGVGVIVLQRVRDALSDNHRIDAVVRGWAINNDGGKKASYLAPKVQAQADVIRQAQRHANVLPAEISYVEAHGTGTQVGDPIEVEALIRAFGSGLEPESCAIGTVKGNIGHLDVASGVAGVVKTVLALKHKTLPANLHFRQLNKHISFTSSPFYVADRLLPWRCEDRARIAGVSSFGVGGTNCHVVLQQSPQQDACTVHEAQATHLVTLSAKSESALKELVSDFHRFMDAASPTNLAAIAATTQRSRSMHEWRYAVVGETLEQFQAALDPAVRSDDQSPVPARRFGPQKTCQSPCLGFVFSGQGAQYPGMARTLFDTQPVFRQTLHQCDRLLREHLDKPLLEILFTDYLAHSVNRTDYLQPALFSVEYALVQTLSAWNIEPNIVMGHSVGEYTAACVAGVYGLKEGLAITAQRGKLMQAMCRSGKMLSVMTDRETLQGALDSIEGEVSIAATNSPSNIVISGNAEIIDETSSRLKAAKIYFRELSVSHAFHSSLMEPVIAPIESLFSQAAVSEPNIKMISGLTGNEVSTEVLDPRHWGQHTRNTVAFAECIAAARRLGCTMLVEIGPRGVSTLYEHAGAGGEDIPWVTTLCREQGDLHVLSTALAHVFLHGVDIDWRAYQRGNERIPLRLPAYPFAQTKYWYEGADDSRTTPYGRSASVPAWADPLLGRRMNLPGSDDIRFEAMFSKSTPAYVDDHRLFGIPVLPGAGHLAMLAQARPSLVENSAVRFEMLYFLRPLTFPTDDPRQVQLVIVPSAGDWQLRITSAGSMPASLAQRQWTDHLLGRVEKYASRSPALDVGGAQRRADRIVDGAAFYARIWANQGGTGAAFRWIDTIWQGQDEAICRALRPSSSLDMLGVFLHPGVIEAACQVLHCCRTFETQADLENEKRTYVPSSIDEYVVYNECDDGKEWWCYAALTSCAEDEVVGDLTVSTASGQVMVQIKGFRLRRISQAAVQAAVHHVGHAVGDADHSSARPDAKAKLASPAVLVQDEVCWFLQQQCARLTGYSAKDIVPSTSFIDLGLDSLAAILLAQRVHQHFGLKIPISRILSSENLVTLADYLCQQPSES